jgi:hypothetical protein
MSFRGTRLFVFEEEKAKLRVKHPKTQVPKSGTWATRPLCRRASNLANDVV